MDQFDCDVLIAGGGPTGVTLAILLAKRGIKVVVAEREADIYPLPRAAHIDHEGMRILQEAGVADEVMVTSRRAPRYEFRNAKGDLLLCFTGADRISTGGWPAANMIHQPLGNRVDHAVATVDLRQLPFLFRAQPPFCASLPGLLKLCEQLLHVDVVAVVQRLNRNGPEAGIPGRVRQEGIIIDRGTEDSATWVLCRSASIRRPQFIDGLGQERLKTGHLTSERTFELSHLDDAVLNGEYPAIFRATIPAVS